jgi:hypothetical protein
MVDPDGGVQLHKTTKAVLEALSDAGRVSVVCRQHRAVLALAVAMQTHAILSEGPLPDVAARGDGSGKVVIAGCTPGDKPWHVTTGTAMVGDGDALKAPVEVAGEGPDALALWAKGVHDAWSDEVDELGLDGGKLSAGTAAAAILPRSWIKASAKLAGTEAWQEVRKAYAGGRIACWKEGWRGDAREWDIRSAYGASLAGLLGRMPDFQLYPDRKPMRAQPGWHLATVEVSGPIGPLPYRDPETPWKLAWPTSGRWTQWYTKADLETPGVHVVEIHKSHAGRYMHVLRDDVMRLLDLREGGDPWRRAVIRQLVVSLAGKLGQRPVSWRVWCPTDGVVTPPKGSIHLGDPFGDGLTVYPTRPARLPPTIVPQVASYVTARTRRRLYDAIEETWPAPIYCDTDGVHLPADHPGPTGIGVEPGAWADKESGPAHYFGRRRYYVGRKRVNT